MARKLIMECEHGHQKWYHCMLCQAERNRINRAKNPEKYREMWRATSCNRALSRREQHKKRNRASYHRNKEKWAAAHKANTSKPIRVADIDQIIDMIDRSDS